MRRPSARGFSLFESLVAAVIAAGVVVGLYNAVAASAKVDQRAEELAAAHALAARLVSGLGLERALVSGLDLSGDEGRFSWLLQTGDAPLDLGLGRDLVTVEAIVWLRDAEDVPPVRWFELKAASLIR